MKESNDSIMVSDEISHKIDMSQFYENTDKGEGNLTVSFWTNGFPITSKVQKIKIDSIMKSKVF